ncbi:MAG: hypothetical protein IPP71_10825 [Bacteroidetes bacterium]|nr:hypothetical protein [Bacteroidota bacterium]
MQKQNKKKKARPPQHQNKQPGLEWKMDPQPVFWDEHYFKVKKLEGKVAIISGIHCKPIAATGEGQKLLEVATVNADPDFSKENGIILNGTAKEFIKAIASHRFWRREK